MNTIRAHQCAFDLTFELGANPFEIGPPRALGFVVGVTDAITH